MSSLLTLSLLSVFGAALLAAALHAWRRSLALSSARARETGRGEERLLLAVKSLLDAGRQSSDAVLASLDATIRDIDPSIDGVLVFAPAGDELACIYAGGSRAEHFRRLHLRRDDESTLPVRAANSRCRAVYPCDGDPVMPNDRAAIAVPMFDAHNAALRVIYASSSRAESDAALRDSIVRAVGHAATPYAIALERESDRLDATHDGLTGLLAPRAFRRNLHEEFAHDAGAVRSLWFIDIDRFKSINDRYGHPAGDSVLAGVAALLRDHLERDVDVAARNGGDEFCALVRSAGKSGAIERAGAFCCAVRTRDFGIGEPVTVSVGVASSPHDASTSGALLEAADAAMYYSKRNGRDRVSFALDAASFASLRAEAPSALPRSSPQWGSTAGNVYASPLS